MDQMIVIAGVAVLATVFAVYPRLAFRVISATLRGFVGLLADCVALLLAWI